MAKFSTPATQNQELAGSLTEFKDELIALQALGGLITVKTTYGPAKALRCQVVDPLTGDDKGIRLLYWATVQTQLTAAHVAGDDWLVGVIVEQPQKDDPTKSYYSIVEASDLGFEDIDWSEVGAALDRFEQRKHAETHPQGTLDMTAA